MMTILIESLVVCLLFFFFLFVMSRRPMNLLFNYPPAIIERCRSLGLVNEDTQTFGIPHYGEKCSALIVFGIFLGILARTFNGCSTFWEGAIIAYVLWCVVDWFDAIVLNCMWFCHDKHFIIPGTEDMTEEYHNYWFHIKGGFIGMLLGMPAALVAGFITIIK